MLAAFVLIACKLLVGEPLHKERRREERGQCG
jgi:hypothetical protein